MLTVTSNNFQLYTIEDGRVICRQRNYNYEVSAPILKYVDKNTNEVFVVDGVRCEITPTYATLDRKGKDGIQSDIGLFRKWLTIRERPKVKQTVQSTVEDFSSNDEHPRQWLFLICY